MSQRTFFLDTNILIGDPDCIYEFSDKPQNTVVLSDIVWAELDNNKNRPDIMGNVRRTIRTINRFVENHPDCYEKGGAPIGNGRGRFRIYSDNPLMREKMRTSGHLEQRVAEGIGEIPVTQVTDRMIFAPPMDNQNDIALVRQALNYAADNQDEAVTFITRDTSLAAIARINGIHTEFRKTEYVDPNQLHRGYGFFNDEKLYLKLLESCRDHPERRHIRISDIDAAWTSELIANQYMIYADPAAKISLNTTLNRELIFRYDLKRDELTGIPRKQPRIFDRIKPWNFPQALLIETAKSGVDGIAVSGGAGTGKTYMLLALALERVVQISDKGHPGKLYISKRDVKVANEQLGFAPGERENKLKLHGVATNYAQIARTAQLGTDYGSTLMEAMRDDEPLIELLPIGEIRGMNVMENEGLLIEEAQNLEYNTAKAVATRVAKGGFYFLNGDCNQPDNPYLSGSNNGLTRTMHAIVQMSYFARGITHEEFKGVDRYYQRRQSKISDNPRLEAKEVACTMGLMFLPTIVRGPIAKFGVNWF